jgi:hypothetical protein
MGSETRVTYLPSTRLYLEDKLAERPWVTRQSAATAQTSARVAFARELAAAAVSSLDTDPERGVLFCLQAVDAAGSTATAALR